MARKLLLPVAALFVVFGAMTYFMTDIFEKRGVVLTVLLVLALLAFLLGGYFMNIKRDGWAFGMTGAVIGLLVTSVFVGCLVDDYAARPGAFGERLSSLVTRVLVSYDEDKYGLLLLSQHHELFTEVLLSRGRQPLDALQDLLEQAVNKGDIPPQNTRLTAVLIIGAFTQLAVSTMQGELEEPLSLLANEVTAHLLALIGLGKGPG